MAAKGQYWLDEGAGPIFPLGTLESVLEALEETREKLHRLEPRGLAPERYRERRQILESWERRLLRQLEGLQES